MPYLKEHSARLKEPEEFDSFARQSVTPGVILILGIKNNISTAQSYRFKKSKFTTEQAKQWLSDNSIGYIKFEPAIEKKEIQSYQIDIQCFKLKEFSQSEIIELIPNDTLSKIKLTDPHPFFTIYSIAHEGISTPKIINGPQSKPIKWMKAAIQSIKNKVLKGVKFYKDHNTDNSTDNRRELGEVIVDLQKDIGGILHHLVIGYHAPNVVEEVKQNDVCSQEGLWDLVDKGVSWVARKLDAITGIALGKSTEDIPAFAGAHRLGMVQAFNNNNLERSPGRDNMAITREELLNAKIDDIKWLVEQKEYHPNQLFPNKEIMVEDRVYGKVYKEVESLAESIKKHEAEKAAIKTELEKTKDELAKRVITEKSIIRREQEQSAAERFEKLLTLQKATDTQKKYAKPRFRPDKMEDLSDDGLQARMLEILEDYKLDASLGILKDEITQTQGGGNPAPGGTGNSADVDYTDAKTNELLEEE